MVVPCTNNVIYEGKSTYLCKTGSSKRLGVDLVEKAKTDYSTALNNLDDYYERSGDETEFAVAEEVSIYIYNIYV